MEFKISWWLNEILGRSLEPSIYLAKISSNTLDITFFYGREILAFLWVATAYLGKKK